MKLLALGVVEMIRKMMIVSTLLLVSLSGCNMFKGLGQDMMNLNHTMTKGVLPDGYPSGRQRVNYHQTQFAPYSGQRYYTHANVPPSYGRY